MHGAVDGEKRQNKIYNEFGVLRYFFHHRSSIFVLLSLNEGRATHAAPPEIPRNNDITTACYGSGDVLAITLKKHGIT